MRRLNVLVNNLTLKSSKSKLYKTLYWGLALKLNTLHISSPQLWHNAKHSHHHQIYQVIQ